MSDGKKAARQRVRVLGLLAGNPGLGGLDIIERQEEADRSQEARDSGVFDRDVTLTCECCGTVLVKKPTSALRNLFNGSWDGLYDGPRKCRCVGGRARWRYVR